MEMTETQKKFLNKADQKARGLRKDIAVVIKEDSKSNKFRKLETADSDECTDEKKSEQV